MARTSRCSVWGKRRKSQSSRSSRPTRRATLRKQLNLDGGFRACCEKLALAMVLACAPVGGFAQASAKPSRFIVPFPPGGGNDRSPPRSAEASAAIATQVIVDNRRDAGGTIGAEAAARSPPRLHDVSRGCRDNTASIPTFARKFRTCTQGFQRSKPDCVGAPAGRRASVASAKSIKDLVALAQALPARSTTHRTAPAALSHLAVDLFDMMTGVKMTHIAYKVSRLRSPTFGGRSAGDVFGARSRCCLRGNPDGSARSR